MGAFYSFFSFSCCCFVTAIKFRSAMGTGIFARDEFFFVGGCDAQTQMQGRSVTGFPLLGWSSSLLEEHHLVFTSSPAPTSFTFLTMQISHKAYLKPLLHAAKYPTTAVNGVFLADASQTVDAVPFFHFWNTLSPMLEVAMTQVPFFFFFDSLLIISDGTIRAKVYLRKRRLYTGEDTVLKNYEKRTSKAPQPGNERSLRNLLLLSTMTRDCTIC